MKMLIKKSRKHILLRWAVYLISAYILASIGVCRMVNPIQNLKSMSARTEKINLSKQQGNIVIEQPVGLEGADFLSFQIEESENYSFELILLVYSQEGEEKEKIIHVWKGWNSLDTSDFLPEGKVWTKIVIPQSVVESEKIFMGSVELSDCKKFDNRRMLYVFLSFLILAAFWESVCWVKGQYTE